MASAVNVEAELGEVAKQVKEGAIAGAEIHEKKETRKAKEDKYKSFLEKHWKALIGLGIGVPVAGFIGIKGFQAVAGFQKGVSDAMAGIGALVNAPLQAIGNIQDLIKGFTLDNIKLPEFNIPKLTDIGLKDFNLNLAEFKLPEIKIPTLQNPLTAVKTNLDNTLASTVKSSMDNLTNLFKF